MLKAAWEGRSGEGQLCLERRRVARNHAVRGETRRAASAEERGVNYCKRSDGVVTHEVPISGRVCFVCSVCYMDG